MKTALALALFAFTDVAHAGLSCGGCYDSSTHVVTCYTAKPSDCMYWYSGYACTTIGYSTDADTCAAEYNVAYGKGCIEGDLAASDCTPFTHKPIAGYVPDSDVTRHAAIDLDVEDMGDCFDEDAGTYDYTCAKTMYTDGGNSIKSGSYSSGYVYRTVSGFATKDLSSETIASIWINYWGSTTYADDWMQAAFDGAAVPSATAKQAALDFSTATDIQRMQLIMKGAVYQATWIYVFHELEAALEDCAAGATTDDGGGWGVHAWDEGMAFYAGTLEGTAAGGNSAGVLSYRLAEKRCGNFGTCGTNGDSTSGTAWVNTQIVAAYTTGLTQLKAGSCNDASATMFQILRYMLVPLIQGTLRYAYKCDPAALNAGDEACAEGWAFAGALLPAIDSCDSAAAAVVYDNMKLSGAVSDGFAAVKSAIESTYSCLEVECSWVGGLLETTDTYYSGMGPCSDELSPASRVTTGLSAAMAAATVAIAALA